MDNFEAAVAAYTEFKANYEGEFSTFASEQAAIATYCVKYKTLRSALEHQIECYTALYAGGDRTKANVELFEQALSTIRSTGHELKHARRLCTMAVKASYKTYVGLQSMFERVRDAHGLVQEAEVTASRTGVLVSEDESRSRERKIRVQQLKLATERRMLQRSAATLRMRLEVENEREAESQAKGKEGHGGQEMRSAEEVIAEAKARDMACTGPGLHGTQQTTDDDWRPVTLGVASAVTISRYTPKPVDLEPQKRRGKGDEGGTTLHRGADVVTVQKQEPDMAARPWDGLPSGSDFDSSEGFWLDRTCPAAASTCLPVCF